MDSFLTESSRWAALETQDPQADGRFVYCVKTTGIYCRPTCGARTARRANIVFRDDASAAQEAGFRACKRCKPDLDKHDPQATLVARARQTIEKTQTKNGSIPSLANLAEEAGLTKSHFHRVFKKITGVTPRVYAESLAKDSNTEVKSPQSASSETPSLGYLASKTASEAPVTPVLHQLPTVLESPTLKNQEFNRMSPVGPQPKIMGMNNTDLIDVLYSMATGLPGRVALPKSRPKEIFYTIQPWKSSYVLIAMSPNGVCLLDIEDSSDALLGILTTRFPDSNLALSSWSPAPPTSSPKAYQNSQDAIFDTIMKALVNPTGKILDIPFDLH